MHTRGAVSLRPGSQQGQRRDSVSVGVVRGVSPCLAFPSGQGRSAQGCPHPPVSPPPSGGSTLSPHRAHSPPPICAASPVRIRPSRPRAHPTQLRGYKFSSDVSHTQSYTYPITQSCTVCTPHHTQFHRVSPTVSVTASSPTAAHTAPPPTAARTHVSPVGSPAGPPPCRGAHWRHTRSHAHTRVRTPVP